MTWVDIFFVTMWNFIVLVEKRYGVSVTLDNYPRLKGLVQAVESVPGIDEYIQRRPETVL